MPISAERADRSTFPCHTAHVSLMVFQVPSGPCPTLREEQHPLPSAWTGLCPAHPAATPKSALPLSFCHSTAMSLSVPSFQKSLYFCGDRRCLLPASPACSWPRWHPQWGWCARGTFGHLEVAPTPTEIKRDFVRLWGWCSPPATPLLVLLPPLVSVQGASPALSSWASLLCAGIAGAGGDAQSPKIFP